MREAGKNNYLQPHTYSSYAICIMIRDLYRLLFAGWDYSNQRKEEDDGRGGGVLNSSTDTCDILGLCSGVHLR